MGVIDHMLVRAGIAALLGLAATVATAQPKPAAPADFPKKPVRILVGNAPGGGSDITARAVGNKLT